MAGKFPNKRRDTSGPKQSERTAKVKSRLADAEKRAAAGDLAGAAAFAKAALAIQRKGTGGQKSLQRVANVANAYSRAAGQGGVKAGKVARKPAKSGTGKAGTTSTTGTTKAGSQSYVGKPGTRTKSYQTGEGMTTRPKPPSTFQGQRFNIAGPQSRQLRITKPVRVAYEIGSNIPRATYQANRTLADVLRKTGSAARKTATNFWYE